MLKGIDISSHQGNIDLYPLQGVDFVIVKATEGLNYVNPYCDTKYSQARGLGKCVGFYHFAGENNARAEAEYFCDNCCGYFGNGIPVLDWEGNQSVEWVNEFVRYVYERTGVWCWIYGNPWRFNQGGVEPNCARWVASYPNVIRPGLDFDPGQTPVVDGLVAAWQYASDGYVVGYDGNLDISEFYGDRNTWAAYTGGNVEITPAPNPDEGDSEWATLENAQYTIKILQK